MPKTYFHEEEEKPFQLNVPYDEEPGSERATIRVWHRGKWIDWIRWPGYSIIDPNFVPQPVEKPRRPTREEQYAYKMQLYEHFKGTPRERYYPPPRKPIVREERKSTGERAPRHGQTRAQKAAERLLGGQTIGSQSTNG